MYILLKNVPLKNFFSGQKVGQNKGSTQLQKMTAQKVK